MREASLDMNDVSAELAFACPRCAKPATGRFYGPCESCAAELRIAMAGEADANARATEYEPKMNVTPNAVALKDD